jgi:hypothetical protein
MVGFPLANKYTVGSGYLLLLDKGTELVASELVGEAVNELGTAGINNLIVATGLQVLEGSAPTLEEHLKNIICTKQIDFSATPLDVVQVDLRSSLLTLGRVEASFTLLSLTRSLQGCRFKVQGAAALL